MNERTSIPDDLWSLPRSWKEAERDGAKLYFTGKPCPKCGNLDARRFPKGKCVTCERDENRARDQRKREERAAARAAAQAAREEKRLARMAEETTEAVLAEEEAERLAAEEAKRERSRVSARKSARKGRAKKMREIGTEKYRKQVAEKAKERYWADPESERARINERHRSGRSGYRMIRLRTPPWLTDDERAWLAAFEDDTHQQGLEVDHFVPIDDHPDLAGTHVPWNVQALTTAENNQRRRGCVNEFRCTDAEAADYVARGMAVWKKDIAEDGTIDWSRYPRPIR